MKRHCPYSPISAQKFFYDIKNTNYLREPNMNLLRSSKLTLAEQFSTVLPVEECYSKRKNRDKPVVGLIAFGRKSAEKISRSLNLLKVDYRIILPDEIPNISELSSVGDSNCILPKFQPTHIILSGSPEHVYESDHYCLPKWIIESNYPVLGICYGMQLIAHTFGGTVIRMPQKEEGPVEVTEIIDNVQATYVRWMNRYDQVTSINNNFNITGVTNNNHIASFTDHERWWAVQYHPEASKHGDLNVFRRFLGIRKQPRTHYIKSNDHY